GMLALRMPMKMYYHVPTVVLSLLEAMAASAVALFTVSRERMGVGRAALGSLFMGSGIAAMHYTGIAAIRPPAGIRYIAGLVFVSVVLAVAIALVALLLAFRVRHDQSNIRRKAISALIMGSAIPVMHYTGMWAASFTHSDAPVDLSRTVSISSFET